MTTNDSTPTPSQSGDSRNGNRPLKFPGQEESGLSPAEQKQYDAIKDTPAGKAARAQWEEQQRQMRYHSLNLDFAFYMGVLFLNHYCQEDGAEAGTVKASLTIRTWRNRVLNSCGGNPAMLAAVGPDLDAYCEMLKKVSGIPFDFNVKLGTEATQ